MLSLHIKYLFPIFLAFLFSTPFIFKLSSFLFNSLLLTVFTFYRWALRTKYTEHFYDTISFAYHLFSKCYHRTDWPDATSCATIETTGLLLDLCSLYTCNTIKVNLKEICSMLFVVILLNIWQVLRQTTFDCQQSQLHL